MSICAAGDTHRAMMRLDDDVQAFEAQLGIRFDWVLHVGDFGVWPAPARTDKASRNPNGAGALATREWMPTCPTVRCIGLNEIGHRGNLAALEIDSQRHDWSLLGEFRGSAGHRNEARL